jgi:hypothetical protein
VVAVITWFTAYTIMAILRMDLISCGPEMILEPVFSPSVPNYEYSCTIFNI